MSSIGPLSPALLTSLVQMCFIALVAAAALQDARRFRIPNAFPLALVTLFALAHALGIYHPVLPHLGSFAIAATVGCGLFYARLWGGGDAKLLAALGLFLEPGDLFMLALATSLAGGVIAVVVLIEWRMRRTIPERAVIPYGVALAAGGLNWCFTAG